MGDLQTISFKRSDNGEIINMKLPSDSQFIDLRDIAKDCNLQLDRLKLRVGNKDSKERTSFPLAAIKIEDLFNECRRKQDERLVILVDEPHLPIVLTASKKRKSYLTCPTYSSVNRWLEELNEELRGHEFTFQITCKMYTALDVTSEAEFEDALSFYLKAESEAQQDSKQLDLTLTVRKGRAKSYSTYVGDKGVEAAMRMLMGDAYDPTNPAHSIPEQVAELEEYPPFDLSKYLEKQLSTVYTAGQQDTIDHYIDITIRHLAATLAACRQTASQNEATRRAFIDPILVLVCTIVASLRDLKPGSLQLCMEYGVEEATDSGKIDYVFRYLMSLLSLIEAKGEGGLSMYRGQTLAELAAVKQNNIAEGKKRGWDEIETPASACTTNSSDWEFYVYRPGADPPVVYRQIGTPTELLWKDLAGLRARFMPVIQQLLAILFTEVDRVNNSQAAKRRKTDA